MSFLTARSASAETRLTLLVSVVLFRQLSPKGDWQDALFTTIGCNRLVFVVLFFLRVNSG